MVRRLLEPGELDPLIPVDTLTRLPEPARDPATRAACWRLYHRWVEPTTGARLPDSAFCDLTRFDFLAFLVECCGIVLAGTKAPDAEALEPMVLARNVAGWDKPRLFAFSEPVSPIFHAIADRTRIPGTTIIHRPEGCYFGVDWRALPGRPWRRGTVSGYPRADLPVDFAAVAYPAADAPIRPLFRLSVDPWDWPLLETVHGVDFDAQARRERADYRGYPWVGDPMIHPRHGERAALAPIRALLASEDGACLGLTELSARAGVGPSTLLRRFRAAFGVSPRQCQLLARLHRARRRVRAGADFARVAAETGFVDQSHLTVHFKRVFGVTPGQYRRLQESPIH